MSEFSKKYDQNIEWEIYRNWLKNDLFSPEKQEQLKWKSIKEQFTISMPPPNVTGVLHVWHAMFLSVQDIMVRYARMKGKKALRIPWTDHAGIATQVVVEKKLKKEKNLTRHILGREKFLWEVWDWVRSCRSTIVSQMKIMWASCDWNREQFTLSEKLSRAVRKSFVNLYNQNKIYQSSYIINWCPRCQTVLSDIEVSYKETNSKFYYIRYFIEGKGDFITVATVRPETIFGDVAIAVHPKDRRYKKLIWKNVLIPIINKPIPIIGDESVETDFGTWALKITPAHDPVDYEIWKKHNLKLDNFAIDKDGKLTELAGEFAGQTVESVFENIIQYLKEIWNIEKIEDYLNKIPHCERCDTRLQPLVSKQRFVDVKEAAARSIDLVNKGETKIYPERFNKIFFDWLENIRPWCISRQLRWGHRIPVWYCECGENNVLDEDFILQNNPENKNIILSMMLFNLISDSRLKNPFNLEDIINLFFENGLNTNEWKIYQVYMDIYKIKFKDNKDILAQVHELEKIFDSIQKDSNYIIKNWWELIDILETSNYIIKDRDLYKFDFRCQKCWSNIMRQEEDVLDTWFSSALWPFSILGRPEKTPDFENYYPNTVMETWYDIIFFWVARMTMMWLENTWKKPFDNIYLNGLVRDEKGSKMSKSKWNVVDPLEMIKKYGADAVRLSLVMWSTPWNDVKFSETKVDYTRRFMNKIWNASRFIYIKTIEQNPDITFDYQLLADDIKANVDKLNDFDKRILWKIYDLIVEWEKFMDKFMIWEFAQKILQTVWHDFCDWYIEISKFDNNEYTNKVLLYSISTFIKLLHPFVPFITEKLWGLLKFEWFLMISEFPVPIEIVDKKYKIWVLMDIVSEIRNLKNSFDIKNHEKVFAVIQSNTSLSEFLNSYDDLLKNLLNAEEIKYILEKDDISQEYNTSIIADIKVWIKTMKQQSRKEKLEELERDLKQQEQYLQTLRSVMSAPWFMEKAPQHIIDERTTKMEEVKIRITKLQHEINKIKMNH